jgi:hypothetical protein
MTFGMAKQNWQTRLQRRLDREAVATMEVACGEDAAASDELDRSDQLKFGPYGASPLSGLHFDTPNDSAAS